MQRFLYRFRPLTLRKLLAEDLETRVIPLEFEYLSPKNLSDALSLLKTHGEAAKVLAGGTDLIIGLKRGNVKCKYVISLKNLRELSYITSEKEMIRIGALTKLREVEKSPIVAEKFQALYEAVKEMGSPMVRNMGTIGGNLCNASPAADAATALLALDANLKIAGPSGEKVLPINKFFVGPGKTVLSPTEILTEIQIPYLPDDAKSKFLSIRRVGISVSTVCAAVALGLKGSVVNYVRIGLGAVAPTPIRAYKTEEYLKGKRLSADTINKALEILEGEVSPITDVRGTAEYRRYATKGLVKEAFMALGGA